MKKFTYLFIAIIFLFSCKPKKNLMIDNGSLLKKADSLFISNKFWEAIDVLDSIKKVDSTNAAVYNQKALCYLKLSLFPDALNNINYAIELENNSKIYLRTRSLINYEYKDLDGAIKDCDYLIEKFSDTNSYLLRAQYLIEKRKPELALSDCEKYLSLTSNQIGFAEFLKGKVFLKIGQLDSATYYFDNARLLGYTLSEYEKYELDRRKEEKRVMDENIKLAIEKYKSLEKNKTNN